MGRIIISGLVAFFWTITAHAGMDLSIKGAVELALENNLDIKIEQFNPDIRKTETEKERAVFDPAFTLKLNNAFSKTSVYSELQGAPEVIEKVTDLNLGLKQKFSTGAYSELKFINERASSNSIFLTLNPYYKSDLALSVTQPLFKNFGPEVNLTRINVAENNEKISKDQLRGKMIDIIADTKRAYWNLLLSLEELEVRNLSLELSRDLLKKNRRKVEVGVLAQIEIIEAEAGVATREEAVLLAEKAVRDAEDTLKRITGLTKDWEIILNITDKPIITREKLSFMEMFRTALENRPDYLQAGRDLKNREINLKFTRNQTLPNLSLVGGIGLNGLDNSYGSELERLKTGDFYSWQVGISLEIPLGNRAAQNDYLRAKLEEEKARVSMKNMEEAIAVEIREALRELDTTLKMIDATKVTRTLAEKKLEAEEKKFNVGMSTSHDILIFQEELANALKNEKKSLIDHNNALIKLDKVTGVIVKNTGVVF